MSRRNIDLHTTTKQVEANILAHMKAYRVDREHPMPMSAIGFAGFPGYSFKKPQGAALAVARIARNMLDRGVLRYRFDDLRRGYYPARQP